jgi:hypothetical protein
LKPITKKNSVKPNEPILVTATSIVSNILRHVFHIEFQGSFLHVSVYPLL